MALFKKKNKKSAYRQLKEDDVVIPEDDLIYQEENSDIKNMFIQFINEQKKLISFYERKLR